MGVGDYERHRDMDDGEGVRIVGIAIPFRDIVVVSLKIAAVWVALGAVAWVLIQALQ